MAIKITRNEYFNLIRETGRIPKDDEYEIVSLDLSKYPLTETTKRIVDANFTEECTGRNGNYMLRGHWLSDLSVAFANKCGFVLHQVNYYSSFAYSDEQMAVFTYCEGDITLSPFVDREKYEEEKKSIFDFYKKTYDYS